MSADLQGGKHPSPFLGIPMYNFVSRNYNLHVYIFTPTISVYVQYTMCTCYDVHIFI